MYKNLKPYSSRVKKFFILFVISVCSFGFSFGQNAIVTENALTGNPASEWDIANGSSGDPSIQGFATDISINKGGTINFKIDVNTGTNKQFGIKIYRIGYYQGKGARLIADLGTAFTGIAQNACGYDAVTGLTDCGNWTPTASWAVPSTVVSGLYIAKLTRSAAGGGGSSHIAFVVRDDASTSALYFKTSDATWQAYNPYGGNSLYVGPGLPNNHAAKVSYNRPFLTRDGGGGGGAQEDWFMNSEYPMIRFLEANGFDISYTTDVDVSRSGNLLLNHKVFLSVGHDEYWSKPERDNVEAARTAGKSLAFFSGNEVYWKTRWENSTDGTNTPFRTMVCYKEGTLPTPQENACGGKCDPTPEWTGLWRDGCSYPSGNACKPENALSGNISWDGNTSTIKVPDVYKNFRFWRNTRVASLGAGQTATLTNGTLGYEWDWEQYTKSYPPARITLSSTDFDGHTHKISLYKTDFGGWVFGAGTVQWTWGLDANHDRGSDPVDPAMQQATINLFADMGVQPDPAAVLLPGLTRATASTDVTAPVSTISSPVNGASFPQDIPVTISGTASDVGGIVAGVDISVDGGLTWTAATGTTNWTYTWTPTTQGAITIKSRAYDDSGNKEALGGSEGSSNTVNVTVTPASPPTNCPCTIFTPAQTPAGPQNNDGQPLTLGVKFRAAFDGTISAIRFFKAPGDNANNTVQLWGLDGTLMGEAPLSGSPAPNSWTEVTFTSPITITANTTYVASYFSPTGYYENTDNTFIDSIVRGPLTAISTNDPKGDGPNGVYAYGSTRLFPTFTYNATSYWVDVVYTPNGTGPDITPPTVTFTSPSNGATGTNINGFVSATFNENINPATVTTATIVLQQGATIIPATVGYTNSSRTATLIPSTSLTYSTTYTATVKGGSSGVTDVAGNALAADYTWTFTTSTPPPVPPDDGAGGPVLIISSNTNPFSRYPVEILRAQGYNGFKAMDISEVDANTAVLNDYDVIILGQMALTPAELNMLTAWTNAGGTLVALRPDAGLSSLMGITRVVGNPTLSDGYLLVNTAAGGPGAGIVNQTIQFHGIADLYTLSGATSLATLYSNASIATANPAVTTNNVGSLGGKAIAFTYNLARSIVYTRQGNPLWAGTSRDGQSGPIRSDNLFFPDYIDFNKIAIPQADEQQHLLTNIVLLSNLHRMPLPHLWFLPNGFKAAVVMTGDDHNLNRYPGSTGTAERFNEYMALGPNSPQDVADWKAIRGTSYVYYTLPIPNDSVAYYQDQGFEIALHPNTNCENFTAASLSSTLSTQLSLIETSLPKLTPPVTNRTHCMPWSDWATHPKVESALGIRFDVNYYYWPGSWIQNRPGMFTGSGMPMRFADIDGTIIDCYQAPTQLADEAGMDISSSINTLLDNATGPNGYYGVFVMNMHTDTAIHTGSDKIITSALAHQVPVVSAKQMLTWLDSRNTTAFSGPGGPGTLMTWTADNGDSLLSFNITTTAHNLQAMVPFHSTTGTLTKVKENGSVIGFTPQSIKGILYGVFPASTKSYVAVYSGSTPLPITLVDFTVTKQGTNDALLKWTTSMEQNNKGFEIQRSTDASNWTVIGFVNGEGNSQTNRDYQYTDKNLANGTYYYRLRQVDYDGKSQVTKIDSLNITGVLSLELLQNRPNPLINQTTIDIIIPQSCRVQLTLYDQLGRPVQQLMDEMKSPGKYQVQVNKNGLSSGNYYYKLNAMGQSRVRKMAVL